MKFSKIASDTYEKLQLGAGVFLTTFTPTTGTFEDSAIFGATDGGVSFSATPTFKDLADGIDNATLNLKELKRIDSWEVKMSGTLKTIDTTVAKSLLGAGTVATNKVTANAELAGSDFADLWWLETMARKVDILPFILSTHCQQVDSRFRVQTRIKALLHLNILHTLL